MSSNKGFGKRINSSGKQKATTETTTATVDEINLGVGGLGLNFEQNDGWEVCNRKSKNKGGSSAGKQWVPQNPIPKAWGHPDVVQKLGMRNVGMGRGSGSNWTSPNDPRKSAGRANSRPQLYDRGIGNSYTPSSAPVPPALKNVWAARAASAHPKEDQDASPVADDANVSEHGSEDNESDLPDDSEDELLSDEFDSDGAEMSYEERKKSPCFREFFERLDSLTVAEINDPERQWHCPACKGGPGAIEWFTLQPLMTHAKTKVSRVKLHRKLAELLEEELRQRGTSVVPRGEVYGRWGRIEHKDKKVVWPPMVIIMNTSHDKDENDKWTGMGNQEMLDYCSSYAAVKAQHSYGPQGHRGMSVVIFEASPVGYFEAERLSDYFSKEGRDRDAWEHIRYPRAKPELYGYMAEKRDMDNFNKHSSGKLGLKFEMRSYIETVSVPVKQMWEDNQQLTWFKNKAAKYQRQAKALEESYSLLSEKFRQTLDENKIVRQKTKMHHEQTKEEMEYQEQFFTDQMKIIYDATAAEEDRSEKIQQELHELDKQASATTSSVEDHRHRAEEVVKSIKLQDKEMEELVKESENLIKRHEERIAAVRRGHWEEEIALEKKFDLELAELKEKYSPKQSEQVISNGAFGREHFLHNGNSRGESGSVRPKSGYQTSSGKSKK